MAEAKVTFHRLVQDSQELGSNDEHMVSRAFFTLEVNGAKHDLSADIKQTVGSSYENGPIEVSKPNGYKGPFNHQEFQKAAENYYRSFIGSSGSGLRTQGKAKIRMRNNEFIKQAEFKFEVGKESSTW